MRFVSKRAKIYCNERKFFARVNGILKKRTTKIKFINETVERKNLSDEIRTLDIEKSVFFVYNRII